MSEGRRCNSWHDRSANDVHNNQALLLGHIHADLKPLRCYLTDNMLDRLLRAEAPLQTLPNRLQHF